MALGFYGKLASRGDFVQRGLPRSFVEPWDAWLAGGIAASQQALGEAWLEVYLTSPLWRFALNPGHCGPEPVVGVMMPSVDRVGRYFPLTVAATVSAYSDLAQAICDCDPWFERVENLMLATLETGARFEDFDAAVGTLALPELAVIMSGMGSGTGLSSGPSIQERQSALARLGAGNGCFWWGQGSDRVAPGLRHSPALPGAGQFAEWLLGGSR